MEPLIIPCPAKVNLTLRVVGKRADGYHELDSVMVPLSLADTLTIAPADDGEIHFACDDPALGGDDNLVVRAAHALRHFTGADAGARLTLTKRIPVAAGLGGGSSDAAGALRGLQLLWDVSLSEETLHRLAASLGADVPFFLDGIAARAEGIGDRLTPLGPFPVAHLLLVKPAFGVSAADAYRNGAFSFAPDPDPLATVTDLLSGVADRQAGRMVNDLAAWVMKAYPELARLRDEVAAADPAPVTVMMSGSGPTLFALYRTGDDCRRAESALQGIAPFVQAVTTA
ncbi:MAG: 4-(cytidine 5'-diphospho)-2-C-methyl-D-erythritol kinase [Nitrospinae bacterium]|nr:4-(cytidine 5'-diphospho)-2-C-methyl-D-erythritol kinase [Nitrospinota bacterium]